MGSWARYLSWWCGSWRCSQAGCATSSWLVTSPASARCVRSSPPSVRGLHVQCYILSINSSRVLRSSHQVLLSIPLSLVKEDLKGLKQWVNHLCGSVLCVQLSKTFSLAYKTEWLNISWNSIQYLLVIFVWIIIVLWYAFLLVISFCSHRFQWLRI